MYDIIVLLNRHSLVTTARLETDTSELEIPQQKKQANGYEVLRAENKIS